MQSNYGTSTTQPQKGPYLLTGLLRCEGCGGRMSKDGNSYRCQAVRIGRLCDAPGGAYRRALDDAVTLGWMSRLTTADPHDPLLLAIAERWVAQHRPEATAKRSSVLDALARETAVVDSRHPGSTSERVDELLQALAANPLPCVDLTSLQDSTLVRAAWDEADVDARRDLLRLAIIEVRVSQGTRGQRFDPRKRLTFVWATTPVSETCPLTA